MKRQQSETSLKVSAYLLLDIVTDFSCNYAYLLSLLQDKGSITFSFFSFFLRGEGKTRQSSVKRSLRHSIFRGFVIFLKMVPTYFSLFLQFLGLFHIYNTVQIASQQNSLKRSYSNLLLFNQQHRLVKLNDRNKDKSKSRSLQEWYILKIQF